MLFQEKSSPETDATKIPKRLHFLQLSAARNRIVSELMVISFKNQTLLPLSLRSVRELLLLLQQSRQTALISFGMASRLNSGTDVFPTS